MNKRARAATILRRLRREYPLKGEFVRWSTPLELVIGVVLSAQCTDKKVNEVTRPLFKKYRTARAYARANIRTLEREVHSTGFYRSKARYLKGIGKLLDEKFKGKVPRTLDELLLLPGVSYKSAHLIMAKAFNTPTGIAVDTHVLRVAPRLGLTKHHTPEKIGAELEKLYKSKDFLDVNEHFIMHGRAICKPKPLCGSCVLQDVCPSAKKFLRTGKKRT
ncbi:MAG: hypothetical protein A2677_00375 [Candidatus Komeilibacteria bacterium RIFCSPHIGHO2_01_FULL_52_14]|uniref:Endonuclease III n=1 Tax=Candidatus Komeilibacteria bacterium RIFCSPHIGHO2_01_FULL_52_14 TaxID=1798549 RepID=A0A1G2BP40_9BACT|nr:MAG: hypothetical protein A2677_00375 [Candidatus Komeilibacteria bacterium RIFCSPHIGHO2_01_FULL_52_14]